MKKTKRWLLMTAILLLLLIVQQANGALPFKKVAIGTTPASTTTSSTTTTTTPANVESEEQPTGEGEDSKTDDTQAKNSNSKLTGIPQIDYIWDPNLPRELRGYNLSSYPFFSTVPPEDEIHFKCDGLHDGFYASIEHKCQVYHHCVYGIRHDFLCANFTAFDQKTFICHFVSDVDCAGSQRYWNRNDELYMATTTTSTTTTTTEAPPTPRRRPAVGRPQRPLRRPYNRRPIDDYYYDDEEYDEDYYEERVNRRRKQRPRPRKPVLEYDDEYDEKRAFNDDEKPSRRNRFRDEDVPEDEFDDRRANRPKPRQKPTASAVADRRKATGRKPDVAAFGGRVDERRSFSEDRPRKEKVVPSVLDEPVEEPASNPRRLAGRRRINERRSSTAAALDDLDDYEKPHAHDQEEAAEEEAPQKVKTTPKPLEEYITPKAASSSVYARPRAPPRISRPVPITEKKKYEYPVQKSTATTANPLLAGVSDDDEYYQQDVDYEDTRSRSQTRRRVAAEDDDVPAPVRRRNQIDAGVARKPTRNTLRKPVTDKKALIEEDDYDNERFDSRSTSSARRRPTASRIRGAALRGVAAADDVDFVDDDYVERPAARPISRQRPKTAARKSTPRPRPPPVSAEELPDEEENYETERPQRNRLIAFNQARRKPALAAANIRGRTKSTTRAPEVLHDNDDDIELDAEPAPEDVDAPTHVHVEQDDAVVPAAPPSKTHLNAGRPASVRVVKRPFLPSRGGSPYLPRGLQPVGVALKPLTLETRTTDSTPLDMGSTISGVRLLEHGAPILRDAGNNNEHDSDIVDIRENAAEAHARNHDARTTLPPRSAIPISTQNRAEPQPKINLDELYENDYDVTLNDALDPTLKPLTPQHHQNYNRNYASAYAPSNPFASNHQQHHLTHQQHQSQYQQQHNQYQQQTLASPSSSSSTSSASSALQLQQQQQNQPQNFNSDSYFSSTDIRRRAIVPAQAARTSRNEYQRPAASYGGINARIAQHFYEDFEY